MRSFRLFLLLALAAPVTMACGGDPEPAAPNATGEQASEGAEDSDPVVAAEDTPPSETSGNLVIGDAPCSSDADCRPASCCHPTACVAAGDAPDCRDTMCTMECRGGTMDCGGGCLCHEGHCAARITTPGSDVQ